MLTMNRQSGAVLVISLVILTVLTLIGVASMSGSTLELKVASNAQQHDTAFQAAQNLIEIVASTSPQNSVNYQVFETNPSGAGYEQNLSYTDADGSTADAAVTYSGCRVNIGSSLEEGKAPASNFFRARVTGTTSTGSATSIQMQGIRFPAAACTISL
jgi:type II secretory pathway pseudopilin PulG